jgi:hypothetical protein
MISQGTPYWEIEKIAKFLMWTFTCRSTFLNAPLSLALSRRFHLPLISVKSKGKYLFYKSLLKNDAAV